MIKKTNTFVFITLFTFLFFPLFVSAESIYLDGWPTTDTSYGRNDASHWPDKNQFSYMCNSNPNYEPSDYGMYNCIEKNIHDGLNVYGEVTKVFPEENKIKLYDSGRVDVWGNRNGWEDNGAFSNAKPILYPNMYLKYQVISDIPETLKGYNFTGVEVQVLDFNNIEENTISAETKEFWSTWKVKSYTITDYGLTNDGKFYYTINIPILETERDGLGYNGRIKDNWTDEVVYHYWVPFVAIFTYSTPVIVPPNDGTESCVVGVKDENGIQIKSSQRYAYENPNVCCGSYPETCCGNYEFLRDNWDTTNWGKELGVLCCNVTGEVLYPNNFDIYGDKNLLPPLRTMTYKDYVNNYNLMQLYREKCQETTNSCQWYDPSSSDYCCNYTPYNTTSTCECNKESNFSPGNYCCTKYPDKYPDKCTSTPPDVSDNCDNIDYFNKNKKTCCDSMTESEFKDKKNVCCFTDTTNSAKNDICNEDPNISYDINTNATCIINHQNIGEDYTNVEDVDSNASINNTRQNIQISESITIKPVDNLQSEVGIPKVNPIYGGSSFEYNLRIYSNIKLTLTRSVNFNRNRSCRVMANEFETYRNNMNSKIASIINSEAYKNEVITINGYEYEKSNGYTKLGESNITYVSAIGKRCQSGVDMYGTPIYDWLENFVDGEKSYISTITYKYSYDVKLPVCYLRHGHGTDATCEKNKSGNNDYYSIGRAYFVNENQKKGMNDIVINIRNGGVTGSINTNTGGNSNYTCQYQVSYDTTPINECPESEKYTDECCGKWNSCPPNLEPEIFRPISLSEPFPNRDPGANWYGNSNDGTATKKSEKYITNAGNSVYFQDPIYSITLTPNDIRNIKAYNNTENSNGGYDDWNTMSAESNSTQRISNFLTFLRDGGAINGHTIQQISNITLPTDNIRKTKNGELNASGLLGREE